jgi:hypothetical protein
MRMFTRVLLCGAFLAGCGKADEPASSPPPGTSNPSPGSVTPPPSGNPAPTTVPPGPTTPPPGGTVTPPTPEQPPTTPVVPGPDASAPAVPTTGSGGAPYGCKNCTRLFNGMNLDGWDTAPGAWVVKEGGVLASTGKAADIYTHEDLGDYRVFFQVRHLPAMGGKDHKPCTVMFGKRPGDPMAAARSLGGAQFQPPNGGSWNYGVGGKFTQPAMRPMFDVSKWHQCEVLVKEAGSFHAACCPVADAPCKTQDVLSWTGTGRKHPFDIMMHNGGLFDEYREIWIERSPTEDGLLSQK